MTTTAHDGPVAEHFVTIDHVADFLAKPRSWVYANHLRLGIPSRRIGNCLRFKLSEIEAWVDEQTRLSGLA